MSTSQRQISAWTFWNIGLLVLWYIISKHIFKYTNTCKNARIFWFCNFSPKYMKSTNIEMMDEHTSHFSVIFCFYLLYSPVGMRCKNTLLQYNVIMQLFQLKINISISYIFDKCCETILNIIVADFLYSCISQLIQN